MTRLQGKNAMGLESETHIKEYNQLFVQLMDLSEHIDGHYRKQLKTHEADYKKAYEGQMQKVRKELQFLKMKKAEANGALMNDDRITNLRYWI